MLRIYRHLLGFLLLAGPGFGIGVVVFVTIDVTDWPIAIAGAHGEFIRWGIVGAAPAGLAGFFSYPPFHEIRRSFMKPGTQEAIGTWGLLTWEAGLRGPVIVWTFFAGWVGGFVGGFVGNKYDPDPFGPGGILGALTGALVGSVFGILLAAVIIAVAWTISAVIGAVRRYPSS